MHIVVCVKRVPEVAEAELEIDPSGQRLREEDLAFGINEWDNFAIEAAVQMKEARGATVTAMTVGDEDAEEVLRRALAMGADEAVHLVDPAFADSDSHGIATLLHRAISRKPFDLVLTGAVSGDRGSGQVGAALAEMLGVPHVVLATGLDWSDDGLRVRHEVESGLERVVALDLPALVTVQTGLNEPRYVSIRGIRKVAAREVAKLGAAQLELDPATLGRPGAQVVIEKLFLPSRGDGAEILEGDEEQVVSSLVERLQQQGVL